MDGLLNTTLNTFFPGGIAYEVACEATLKCTTDMFSFKAFLTRWMAATTKMAPYTAAKITPVLATSAVAAAEQCNGGDNGRTCGLSWSKGTAWDGTSGVGQQMAAMSVIFTNLVPAVAAPLTNATGGTSAGNPDAGSQSAQILDPIAPATTGGKIGAGLLTTLWLISATGMFGWMSF